MAKLKNTVGDFFKSASNLHFTGQKRDIFLFATARGGSTWVMELIASQPGMKYYDEPLNIRRRNVQLTRLFHDWSDLMPESHKSEQIVQYLKALQVNRYRFMNPPPFRKHHRLISHRIVFKIHQAEHLINRIKKECDALIVYLLRHPIPTTLSRNVFPRLDLFLHSNYYQAKIGDQRRITEIKALSEKGSHLEKGLVSWCYENIDAARFANTFDWLFITYEELLLNSKDTCSAMANYLSLDRLDKMLVAINTPAANIKMSHHDTFAILSDPDEEKRKYRLVTKWKERVTDAEEKRCAEILALFGLETETYSFGSFVASDRFLINAKKVNALNT